METPTDADLRLLRLILDLTEGRQGRPPTLAEIAVAAGFQSSSRGNIQRQLLRLKPRYVTWTSSPRSLMVTSAGRGLLGRDRSQEGAIALPVSDAPLALLASGVTWLADAVSEGRPLQIPYPIAWQRGLNLLAAECLQRGVTPPCHTLEALQWCQRPILSWPISFTFPSRLLDQPLLEGEQPTELCRELALGVASGEAEFEHCENRMQHVRMEAAVRRSQEGYVAFRRYVIENPVVTEEGLLTASFELGLEHFGGELQDIYEPIPSYFFQDESLWLCGRCGWTLERRDGRQRCGDDRCRKLTANFTRGTRTLSAKASEHWLRVRRPIRRYIVVPGLYEVEVFRQLQALQYDAELWPGFDSYDLRIAFVNGQTWAVDLKDWRYPHLLARHLTPLSSEGNLRWDKAFYVIPDDRVADSPSYLNSLHSATEQLDFTVMAISEFLAAVQTEGEGVHG